MQQTRVVENFQFGVTDPTYNPVCLDADGNSLLLPGVTNPDQCSNVNKTFMGNPNLQPGLVPFDLSRNGSLFHFHGQANVNQYAFYFSDTIKYGKLTLTPGLRIDRYDGLSQATSAQPRIGLAYLITPKTVLRMAYARTFETPYNDNLILSSGTCAGCLAQNVFGSNSVPLHPGR